MRAMHSEYSDITSRIPEAPSWYDENGTPRYGEFTPMMLADIYADECVLMEVGCQGCALVFRVAMSSSVMVRLSEVITRGLSVDTGEPVLAKQIVAGSIHYGDPPNHVKTDHAGSTMNSIPRRVVEYWSREAGHHGYGWKRRAEFEIAIDD